MAPEQLTGARAGLLILRFLAELGMLAAWAWVGLRCSDSWGLPLAVLLALMAASAWGRWVAPRAGRRLRDPARLAVELALFSAAVAALVTVVGGVAATTYAVLLGAAYLLSLPVRRHEPTLP